MESLLRGQFSNKLSESVKNNPGKMVFTLSTLGLDGAPRARVMTLPNISEPDGVLSFGTSKESSKWAELERDPRFEACFYFPGTEEQYRMRGNVVKFQGLEKEVWDKTPEVYRKEFEERKAKTGKDTFGVIQFTPNLSLEHRDSKTRTTTRV